MRSIQNYYKKTQPKNGERIYPCPDFYLFYRNVKAVLVLAFQVQRERKLVNQFIHQRNEKRRKEKLQNEQRRRMTTQIGGKQNIGPNQLKVSRKNFKIRSNSHAVSLKKKQSAQIVMEDRPQQIKNRQKTSPVLSIDLILQILVKHCLKQLMVIQILENKFRNIYIYRHGNVVSCSMIGFPSLLAFALIVKILKHPSYFYELKLRTLKRQRQMEEMRRIKEAKKKQLEWRNRILLSLQKN